MWDLASSVSSKWLYFIINFIQCLSKSPFSGRNMFLTCGTLLSWTSSIKTWPNGGEIDIIEAVNLQTNNEVVLHTGGTCSMTSDNDPMTGMQGSPTCGNADGCTVKDRDANSYGKDFNKAGGGVYAMERTATAIKVWWWARNHIPKDVAESKPNPQGWPQPVASFSGGGCDFDHLFTDHQIVGLRPMRGVNS